MHSRIRPATGYDPQIRVRKNLLKSSLNFSLHGDLAGLNLPARKISAVILEMQSPGRHRLAIDLETRGENRSTKTQAFIAQHFLETVFHHQVAVFDLSLIHI